MTVSVLGITLHLYGFILGVAAAATLLQMENLSKKDGISADCFWKVATCMLVGAVIGARIWHIATDFHLYNDDLLAMFQVWRGGLSILGAVSGGFIGIALSLRYIKSCSKSTFFNFSDSIVSALPIGQIIGRFGNYFNQELYGKPTDLPWGIFISEENRETNYQAYSHFHPLFAYEAVALLIFLIIIHSISHQELQKRGSGYTTFLYICYYGSVRFFLDFLRLDKPQVFFSLGINQIVLLLTVITSAGILLVKYKKDA